MKIKRIALIGLGAMGVFFAPRLYEAFGDDFYIIAGGERKERLESKGVTINGVNYRFPIVTPEEQGEAGGPDPDRCKGLWICAGNRRYPPSGR